MPTVAPIQGSSSFFANANSTYTCETVGGVWSTGDETIATIDPDRGIATGVSSGNTQIIYTVSGNASALNIQVQTTGFITNGFNPTQVLAALNRRVLWKSQGVSQSGRYFQDFHPLANESYLRQLASIDDYADYAAYLSSLNDSVVLECVNAVYNAPQIIDKSQLVFQRSDIMLVTQPVDNQNPPQFVGLKMQLAPGDYGIKVSNLMLFFNETITIPIYLYNDFDEQPMYKLMATTSANQQKIINLQDNVFLNYLTPANNKGGIWYFGYYQADVIAASPTARAIYYPIVINQFHPVVCWSFSAPTQVVNGSLNFQRQVVGANNLTYGMNLEISTIVDATNNIVENPSLWDNLIGLKAVTKNIETYVYSDRVNGVQSIIQNLGGLDRLNDILNGRPGNYREGEAKIVGLIERVNDAIETVKQGFEEEYRGGIGLIRC